MAKSAPFHSNLKGEKKLATPMEQRIEELEGRLTDLENRFQAIAELAGAAHGLASRAHSYTTPIG